MARESEKEEPIPGQYTRASPHGRYIAFVNDQVLHCSRISKACSTYSSSSLGLRSTEVTSVQWNNEETKVLIVSTNGAEVFDNTQPDKKAICKLTNGTGGFGHLSSAEFVSDSQLLSIWEFGKARLWNLDTGKGDDLPDVKTTCDGRAWCLRPLLDGNRSDLLALLSRNGHDDHIHLYFPSRGISVSSTKAQSVDAQSLSWSPDGRWLALQDTTTACPSLYIYTPDGHLFRSYSSASKQTTELGIKITSWSPDNQLLALATHDGKVELLNTRTFSALATIEHTLTIDQTSLTTGYTIQVWQEIVSATSNRSYTLSSSASSSSPISLPLSQSKLSTEPTDLGVAEQKFNSDGTFLATRDCRMLNTIWLWDTTTFSPRAALIQHKNIRKLLWHPTKPNLLLIDCAEPITYLYDPTSPEPPSFFLTGLRPKATLSWVMNTPGDSKPIILAAEKQFFRLLYPEGKPEGIHDDDDDGSPPLLHSATEEFDRGIGEDSLFEILSSRKPLPPKTEPSYTEMVDLEMDGEDTVGGGGLEDTFRDKMEKNKKKATATGSAEMEYDPFDDSEIF